MGITCKTWGLWIIGWVLACVVDAAEETTSYSYDDAGRLISAYQSQGPTNTAVVFQYDLAGNRTGRTGYAPAETDDLDGSGLNDLFELDNFHAMGQDPGGDPDNDTLTNSNEFNLGGDPLSADTDEDGQGDGAEAIAGTQLNNPTSYFGVAEFKMTNGLVRLCYDAVTGRTYQLQGSFNLSPVWTNIGAAYIAGVNGVRCEEKPAATNAYYRVEVELTE